MIYKSSLSFLILNCFTLFATFDESKASGAAYCDNEICSGPEKYCCGHNECCEYVYTIWYIWLALVTGLAILGFVIWKYLVNKRRVKIANSSDASGGKLSSGSLHQRLDDVDSSLLSSSSASSLLTNTHYASSLSNKNGFVYMPLSNNDIFIENHLDENTIKFDLYHAPSNKNQEEKSSSSYTTNSNKSIFKTY